MFLKWIKEAFDKLPGTDDALFQKLWGNSRFLFEGRHGISDAVDYYSARLTAATIRHGGILLLTMPDFQPHRPAFLFATALIRHFLDSRTQPVKQNNTVLYFGSSIGIREQLSRTSIQGLGVDLAHVFSQEDIHRGVTVTSGSSLAQHNSLPNVITVYSPSDSVKLLNIYHPLWIAVDCSDASSIDWLQPLLREADLRRVPVVAWGQNPFSTIVNEFSSFGQSFTWPPNSPSVLRGEMDSLLQSKDPIHMGPFVICGKSSRALSASLAEAENLLSRATQLATSGGRMVTDTVTVHWKYLRSLESLAVPIEFYEAEAQKFWGLQSFKTLEAVCSRFRSGCMQNAYDVYQELETASLLMQQAKNNIETMGCALWEALINICLEDPESDSKRLLVFPNNNRKQLFLFAMLARHNTTDEDLAEMGISVKSLTELRREAHQTLPTNTEWHPLLVGLPSHAITPRILYALRYSKVDIILYPHQRSSFMRQQAEWSVCMSGNIIRSLNTLSNLSNISKPSTTSVYNQRINIVPPIEIDVETTRKTRTSLAGPYWKPNDTITEVERLFHGNRSEFEGEELQFNDQMDTEDIKPREPHEEVWSSEAIRIQFDQGWCAYFAPTDTVNVIRQGSLDSRYVRSLRIDEQVLIIHGQKRQSLYDLIISRVHKHPSIELHLAMIRRWQENIRSAFAHWCLCDADPDELQTFGKRDLNGLLRRMHSSGSTLMTSLALNFWLQGLVLCPQQPEDLRRVAEILNMEFAQKHYTRIAQAAIRLRGLHRGLSIKLNNWIQNQVTGAMQQTDDDIIDVELGLTFGDVRSSLLILRVKNIETVTGPFLMSTLGRIERTV